MFIRVHSWLNSLCETAPRYHSRLEQFAFEFELVPQRRIFSVSELNAAIRAALDALFDHGRPARVQLLVLIDRGHRELPIEAKFVGRVVQTSDIEIIEVKFQEIDGIEKVLLVERADAGAA